jgi:hypothetical protein
MARIDPELVKAARANLQRLVAMTIAEKRGQSKEAFTPPPADAAMPPAGAGAMPPPADPMAGGGAPPMDPMAGGGAPMDPMAGGGGPPMDPMAGGDPAGGAPIVQVGMNELMQLVQMMQGGGMPGEAKPKGAGGKNEALEQKLSELSSKIDTLIGFFAAQTGMSPQELVANSGRPAPMGESEMPAAEEEGILPQVGAEGAAPEMPPLEPQAQEKAKPKTQSRKLHDLVGSLLG